jgi:hypothetical protein
MGGENEGVRGYIASDDIWDLEALKAFCCCSIYDIAFQRVSGCGELGELVNPGLVRWEPH